MLIQNPPDWGPVVARTGDANWDRMAQSLLRSVAVAVPHAVGQGAEQVMDAAIAAWPIQTGRSREALELTYETSDTTYSAVLDCEVDYAKDIHRGATVVDLILTPATEAIPGIVAELERLIGRV